MGRLFGTDGVRGLAGESPLTPSEVHRLARAAGRVLISEESASPHRVLIVRDTRWSGPLLAQTISDGLREVGIHVYDGGVLSTPSAAYLVRAHRFQSGVVVSASHNPPEFNGIKFFTSDGCKWPDAWEERVEKFFSSMATTAPARERGVWLDAQVLGSDYEEYLIQTLDSTSNFAGLKIAMDCSHGANYELGPRLLRRLGADVTVMGARPDGRNINQQCGSQHPRKLAEVVLKHGCIAGVAFDGDGDRLVMVDEKGGVIDGDHIIALLARYLKKRGELRNNTVVITVMANLGLRKALRSQGIRTIEVAVGDRYVSEAMRKNGAVLGGEQSGHIIMGRYLPTGDGLLTALHVLRAVQEDGRPLSMQLRWMTKFPQVLLNVPVKRRVPIPELDGVQRKIESIERSLGQNGRVLVRYSGTEPLLRIMLEGPEKGQLDAYASDIADAVSKAAT